MNREMLFFKILILFLGIQMIRGCVSCANRNTVPPPDYESMIAVSCADAPPETAAKWAEWQCIIDGDVTADWLDKEQKIQLYILRFAKIAQQEQLKYGIPASISIAQGILESAAGYSLLAIKHHNHFGIKCWSRSCSRGHCANFSDDSHKDFFKIYPSAWHSWRSHSEFLNGKRYEPCHKNQDYKQWAHCLQSQGYATSKTYAVKLIRLIEKYNLHQYDTPNPTK